MANQYHSLLSFHSNYSTELYDLTASEIETYNNKKAIVFSLWIENEKVIGSRVSRIVGMRQDDYPCQYLIKGTCHDITFSGIYDTIEKYDYLSRSPYWRDWNTSSNIAAYTNTILEAPLIEDTIALKCYVQSKNTDENEQKVLVWRIPNKAGQKIECANGLYIQGIDSGSDMLIPAFDFIAVSEDEYYSFIDLNAWFEEEDKQGRYNVWRPIKSISVNTDSSIKPIRQLYMLGENSELLPVKINKITENVSPPEISMNWWARGDGVQYFIRPSGTTNGIYLRWTWLRGHWIANVLDESDGSASIAASSWPTPVFFTVDTADILNYNSFIDNQYAYVSVPFTTSFTPTAHTTNAEINCGVPLTLAIIVNNGTENQPQYSAYSYLPFTHPIYQRWKTSKDYYAGRLPMEYFLELLPRNQDFYIGYAGGSLEFEINSPETVIVPA